jgi:hypothetical protein
MKITLSLLLVCLISITAAFFHAPYREYSSRGRLDLIPQDEQEFHIIALCVIVNPNSFIYINWKILTPNQLEAILEKVPKDILREQAQTRSSSTLVYKVLKNKLGEVNFYTISRNLEEEPEFMDKILPVVLADPSYFDDPLFKHHLRKELYCIDLESGQRGLSIRITSQFKVVDDLESLRETLGARRCLIPDDAKLELTCKEVKDSKISCIILSDKVLAE